MKVVVVELPAKAKTINKYLGKDYEVLASFGHIRDLPAKDGSVDPEPISRMIWEVESRGREARRRDRQGGQGSRKAHSGDRPGPRGRGHFLARARGPAGEAGPQGHARRARHLQRHHQGRRADGHAPSARRSTRRWSTPIWPAAPSITSSASPCRRCSGASCPARARPAASSRSPCGSSATVNSRSRTSCRRSTGPSLPLWRPRTAAYSTRASSGRTARRSPGSTSARARKRKRSSATSKSRPSRSPVERSPPSATPTRRSPPRPCSRRPPQARLRAGADHAHRPAPLRGRRYRRRDGGAHHLHAHRRRRHGAGGGRSRAGASSARNIGDRYLPAVPRQIHRPRRRTRRRRTRPCVRPIWAGCPKQVARVARARAGPALRADLDPHRREPDGIGRTRAHHRRDRGAGRPAASSTCARPARS